MKKFSLFLLNATRLFWRILVFFTHWSMVLRVDQTQLPWISPWWHGNPQHKPQLAGGLEHIFLEFSPRNSGVQMILQFDENVLFSFDLVGCFCFRTPGLTVSHVFCGILFARQQCCTTVCLSNAIWITWKRPKTSASWHRFLHQKSGFKTMFPFMLHVQF